MGQNGVFLPQHCWSGVLLRHWLRWAGRGSWRGWVEGASRGEAPRSGRALPSPRPGKPPRPLLLRNDFAGWRSREQRWEQTMSCLFYSGCSHLLPLPPASAPKARKTEPSGGEGKRGQFQGQVRAGVCLRHWGSPHRVSPRTLGLSAGGQGQGPQVQACPPSPRSLHLPIMRQLKAKESEQSDVLSTLGARCCVLGPWRGVEPDGNIFLLVLALGKREFFMYSNLGSFV